MANPETKVNQYTFRHLNPSEVTRIIAKQVKSPTEVTCIINRDGVTTKTTRVPYLHKKYGMETSLDKLYDDMLTADEVIVRESLSLSFSPHARQKHA